jgi:ABC-2 type transport system permease protein
VAAIMTFGTLLLLWILDYAARGGQEDNVLRYLSLLQHIEPMLRGMFDSADIVYFLLLISTFILLSIRRLDDYRLQH